MRLSPTLPIRRISLKLGRQAAVQRHSRPDGVLTGYLRPRVNLQASLDRTYVSLRLTLFCWPTFCGALSFPSRLPDQRHHLH